MKEIKMVDLFGQYIQIKNEIDESIQNVIQTSCFINGPAVSEFQSALQDFLQVKHVIPCANGTDSLQIALMALDLEKGAEIIIPAFSFAAPAEVTALLGYIPVFADVSPDDFNISLENIEKLITERTRAIIPVHLFGQAANMARLTEIAKKHNLYIVEDNAQSLGATYFYTDGTSKFAGTIGEVGTTSFFPSKNLGCMGDGGAVFTNNDAIAHKAFMIANHGQKTKYDHQIIGINSRLDTMQAAILNVKLRHLHTYNSKRKKAAHIFNHFFEKHELLQIPENVAYSDHVYNQYTLKVPATKRDLLRDHLHAKGIPTMIYYPAPLHLQPVFKYLTYQKGDFPVAEKLCTQVLSLPMHTELHEDQLIYISQNVLEGLEKLNIKDVLL